MPIPFLIGGIAALGSALSGVGAAAAAVGGAAAAAGTAAAATVGGAVAAAGTAVASTAVGSAVVGAATTVGTAVAGSAVGTAAVGAMTAVGTGVGAVAGTATALPVIGTAAGTVATITGGATGAAAVGTIATTGAIGAATGISGAAKLSEASDIKDAALSKYNAEKAQLEKVQESVNSALKSLGADKLKIWQSFERFSVMYSKIQNPPTMSGEVNEESLILSSDELDQIKAVAISAKDMLSGGVASVAAGNLIGLAVTSGLVGAAQASTGIAISALHGAAATNATLAALGGGALHVGGAGMAGGAAVMSGLTMAPVLMFGGIMLNGKGSRALESAKDVRNEADKAVETMKQSETELRKVRDLSKKIQEELGRLNVVYDRLMSQMEEVVAEKADYKAFTCEEKRALEKTVLALKLLKHLSMQNILDPKKENTILTKEVVHTLRYVKETREQKLAA